MKFLRRHTSGHVFEVFLEFKRERKIYLECGSESGQIITRVFHRDKLGSNYIHTYIHTYIHVFMSWGSVV